MRCLSPIWMYDSGKLTPSGKRRLSASPPKFSVGEASAIPVPCGHCAACLQRRKNEWINRLRFECFSSSDSSFVTLTYASNPGALVKSDIQLFLKRLRNLERDRGIHVGRLRYFVAGEYGKRFARPHWHGIIFGIDFLRPEFAPRMVACKNGHPIYSSSVLESIWNHGFVTCDRADDLNIKYVAKYCIKDDSVVLKSQGLGRSLLVDVSRKGRRSSYRLKEVFKTHADDGVIYLPSKNKGFSPVPIPHGFDRYLERCDFDLYTRVKDSRAAFVRSLPFDGRSVAERERTIFVLQSAQKQERLLDNET